MLSINLENRVAVVTGVSTGIGAAVAEMLAKAGCHVAGCARASSDSEGAVSFIRNVEKYNREAYYEPVDVTRKEQIDSFVEHVGQRWGHIDIVVSSAGLNVFRGVNNCSEEDWMYNHELNLASHWRLGKACFSWLEKSSSAVFIVMSSNHAYSSIPGCFPYNVTKSALTGLVQAMAIEWGSQVRVVGLAPGFIDTEGNDKWFESFPDPMGERERTIALHPVGRLGTSDEVGAWCAFLASDYAAFATGTTYLLDGGRSALMQDS